VYHLRSWKTVVVNCFQCIEHIGSKWQNMPRQRQAYIWGQIVDLFFHVTAIEYKNWHCACSCVSSKISQSVFPGVPISSHTHTKGAYHVSITRTCALLPYYHTEGYMLDCGSWCEVVSPLWTHSEPHKKPARMQ